MRFPASGVFLCGMVLFFSSSVPVEAALCFNDSWGINTAEMSGVNATTVRITARSRINHDINHFQNCDGVIWATATLSAFSSPACSQPGGLYHTSPLLTMQVSAKNCTVVCDTILKTQGTHWWQSDDPDNDTGYTESDSFTIDCPPDPAEECALLWPDYYWSGSECVFSPGSPIIVDVGGDGYSLTSVAEGVRFDLDADGVQELVAWTALGSNDAFLALDRNGNGRIDNGSELFGNYTPLSATVGTALANNGFEALKALEAPSYGQSFPDEFIDSRDNMFSRLMLWRDQNRNGVSELSELVSVSSAGLVGIDTEYKNKRKTDQHGNEFRQRSEITWSDGSRDFIFDVWLQRQ